MGVVDEGIPSSSRRSKPLIFFEGEPDHRVPVHNQSLRLTGSFKALGRIIGHSILHGGPGLYGLSPAVKHVLTSDSESCYTPLIVAEDIADMDLRSLVIHHLNIMSAKAIQTPVLPEEREELAQYLLEAGIDPDTFPAERERVMQELMLFYVIEQRGLEINDIAKGMYEVSFATFLVNCSALATLVFPQENERLIEVKQVQNSLYFEQREENESTRMAVDFFLRYIKEIEQRKKDGAGLVDLIHFWTAGNTIQDKPGSLLVKFANENVLPLSETCFKTTILPTMHPSFESFMKNMDIALTFGAHGFDLN